MAAPLCSAPEAARQPSGLSQHRGASVSKQEEQLLPGRSEAKLESTEAQSLPTTFVQRGSHVQRWKRGPAPTVPRPNESRQLEMTRASE